MSEDTPFEPVESKEESFGAETPVTGKTKMQAAWSGSDDEKSSAQVAQSQQGQIFEQIYQPWTGTLNPRWMRKLGHLTPPHFGNFQNRTQTVEYTY